jgi:hypothetical protein
MSASELFDEIVAKRYSVIDALVADGREETLHLEFKEVERPGQEYFTKEDKKRIAETLSGLANADGGLLIIGVRTEREDNVDVARELKPFNGLLKRRNILVAMLGEVLNPEHPGIRVEQVEASEASADTGYLLVHVAPSQRRPHMSVKHHTYFRRGSTGTRPMEHGEVKDLMLAPRGGELKLVHHFRRGSHAGTTFSFDFRVALRNVGLVAVCAPFLTWRPHPDRPSLQMIGDFEGNFRSTPALERKEGAYGRGGVIVHIEEQVEIAQMPVVIVFPPEFGSDFAACVERTLRSGDLPFTIRDFHTVGPDDHAIQMEVSYGAKNLPAQSETVLLTKREVFEAARIVV